MATSWSSTTKNTASYTNEAKSDEPLTKQLLLIGEGFNLLIDSTYKLEIQPACDSCVWSSVAKS